MNVSAVIPTRGDVDLRPILATLPFDDIVVWDNSRRDDMGIYGRYAAIHEARHPVIYTQDDDVMFREFDSLMDAYEPGVLTVNYPEPYDIPWVARGSLFDRNLPDEAFDKYRGRYPFDRYFTHYACDGVFGLLAPVNVIDVGSEDLPQGFWPGRVSTSPGWYSDLRPEIIERCASLR